MNTLKARRQAVRRAEQRLLERQRITRIRLSRLREQARQRLLGPVTLIGGFLAGAWVGRGVTAARAERTSATEQDDTALDRVLALVRLGTALWPLWLQWREPTATSSLAPDHAQAIQEQAINDSFAS